MSTLNENILKVKETFEDIASAIEEKGIEISPCDSPMVYGDRIRSIVEQVVFDPEKIYAEAHDIDEPQPTVEVMKSEDNGAIFIFGLRRGAPGKDGEDGTPGQDGITPQLKIEDGYWYVSYDNGSTWTRLSKATGEDGAPGQDGQDGKDGADGIDGKDGSGIEYIFCVTGPNINSGILHNELLTAYSSDPKSDYQKDNFKPENTDWTVEPSGVSAEKPLEWVSIRKRIDGVWNQFSMPIKWNTYVTNGKDGEDGKDGIDGKDALEYKTSYVFTRSFNEPVKPSGGNFESGLPSNTDVWSDAIPVNGEGEVWMSYRMFRSDNVDVDNWSIPIKMTDTHNFEVIYGTENAKESDLPTPPYTTNSQSSGWYDEAVYGLEFHYIATSTFSDGKWSNWIVSKIKGEKGDKGEDGKSVSIKGKFQNEAALRSAWEDYFGDTPTDSGFVYPLSMGDGYIVEDTGDLWIHDGNVTSFDDSWTNVGKIQGEPGKSSHIYIGYRNSLEDSEVLIDGRVGCFIGIRIIDQEITDENLLKDPTFYTTWTKWVGDDGWGWEQVFMLSDNIPPKITPEQSYLSENELIGLGWTDKPIDPNDVNTHVWYLKRKSNATWEGSGVDENGNIIAAYFTHYVKDGADGKDGIDGADGKDGVDGEPGRGIISVEKLFAVNNDPNNNPTEGWTTIENVSTSPTNRYMWCKETTIFTSGDPTVIYYIVTIEGEPGADGTGGDAPIIYPAGVWNPNKSYSANSTRVPYVYFDGTESYWVLDKNAGEKYKSDLDPEEDPNWQPIDSFEAIYSDIGLFNQALVGKWVFHGDYMFSQDGVLGYYYTEETKHALYVPSGIGSGTRSEQNCSYEVALNPTLCQYSGVEFNTIIRSFNLWEKIENGIWIPNVLFNAVTGEGWFAGKKIQFNVDGSGSLGNGISWDNTGDITIEGSIFNPVVNATSSNCLNKTVCVSGDMKNPTIIRIDPYVAKSSNISIKRIGSIVVTSINLENPTYVTFAGASLQVSKIHTDKNDAVISHNNTYDSFIISPGATVTFDVFDDYTNGKRYLRPQIQMGWFNRLGEILPCTFNNIDYFDISAITYTANSIGGSINAGQFYELISLPENLVKYMSIKFNSLNDTYNHLIYFQKEAAGIGTEGSYSIATALNKTFYVRNSVVPFREGGSFGIGAYGVSPSISNDACVDICLYDSNTMIGWFGFNI